MTTSGAPSVVVIDYGSGNLRSAERALARVGADVSVTDGPRVRRARPTASCCPASARSPHAWTGDPQVGADALVRARVAAGRPVLGICVGMQVLYQSGEEHGARTTGIGALAGDGSCG